MSAEATAIAGIAYAFPAATRNVRELATAGAVTSDARVLEEFGFDRVHVAGHEQPFDLALDAGRQLLNEQGVNPEEIDLLVYGGAPATTAYASADEARRGTDGWSTTARFRYPATRLQFELGLTNASVLALDQLACTTLFGAVRVARAIGALERTRRSLCVVSDFYPPSAGREAIYNCTSDAACALLLERGGRRNRIVASAQVTKGYYWDADVMRDEIVASYFPTARHVIDRAIAAAGWERGHVDWIIPHNVSRRSWVILMGLLGLPRARVWTENIPRIGHTLAGDNFINLRDALACGAVEPGHRLLLFSYGYGAHWTALAVEA